MFVGFSKNIGGGFRVGVGTRIGGKGSKPTKEQLKNKDFKDFMNTAQYDMNVALVTFIEANNQDYKKIVKDNIDLDELFNDNNDYREFMSIFKKAKTKIDKIIYTGENGLIAKRKIASEIFDLKDFISKKYPNFQTKYKVKKNSSGFFSKLFIFIKWFFAFVVFMSILDILSLTFSKLLHQNKQQN